MKLNFCIIECCGLRAGAISNGNTPHNSKFCKASIIRFESTPSPPLTNYLTDYHINIFTFKHFAKVKFTHFSNT